MDNNLMINNIEKMCQERGISKTKALIESGVGKDFISDIKRRNTTPSIDKVKKLANYFGVAIDYLLGETSSPNATIPTLKNTTPYDPDKMIPIPVIGRVAAGMTCLAEMDIDEYELTDAHLIQDGYDYVWLRVVGDSMAPRLLEGDRVLVRCQSIVNSGETAVIIVNGYDGVVKKVKIEKDKISLISINPNYPPRVFEKEEMNEVRIFGKVIQFKGNI